MVSCADVGDVGHPFGVGRFRGEVPGIFREVAAHLRNQYSVGYVPSNNKRDGKTRKERVTLAASQS